MTIHVHIVHIVLIVHIMHIVHIVRIMHIVHTVNIMYIIHILHIIYISVLPDRREDIRYVINSPSSLRSDRNSSVV